MVRISNPDLDLNAAEREDGEQPDDQENNNMPHVNEIDNLLRISKSERALQTLQQQQQAAAAQVKNYTEAHSEAYNNP